MDPLRNPKDPLRKSGPQAEQELFRAFSAASNGFPIEMALGASANVLINAIRQRSATRVQAEREFDELFGRMKAVLLDQHYDSSGNRRSVFPFDQAISMPLIDMRPKNRN